MAAVSTRMWARAGGFPVTKPKFRMVSLELFQCRGGQRPRDTFSTRRAWSTQAHENKEIRFIREITKVSISLFASPSNTPPPKAFT